MGLAASALRQAQRPHFGKFSNRASTGSTTGKLLEQAADEGGHIGDLDNLYSLRL